MFNALATYNSEVGRGIMHNSEYVEQITKLQEQFNTWRDDQYQKEADATGRKLIPMSGGGFMMVPQSWNSGDDHGTKTNV
jgi:hypothetical protein